MGSSHVPTSGPACRPRPPPGTVPPPFLCALCGLPPSALCSAPPAQLCTATLAHTRPPSRCPLVPHSFTLKPSSLLGSLVTERGWWLLGSLQRVCPTRVQLWALEDQCLHSPAALWGCKSRATRHTCGQLADTAPLPRRLPHFPTPFPTGSPFPLPFSPPRLPTPPPSPKAPRSPLPQ